MKKKLKQILLGSYLKGGLLSTIFIYLLLIGTSFIFLYPLLKMLATSFMGLEDLVDPTINWIPSSFAISNYGKAIQVLDFWKSLLDSFIVALIPSILIVASSALIGYGFARHEFPGKKVWMALLIVVFLVPTILMSIPTYVTYNRLGILNSLQAYLYPALTGFGIRQTVFILIFYQFFKAIPKELTESAEVDGASSIKVFMKIAIPMTLPAFLISFLYSLVWYWNETNLAILYLQERYTTLQMAVVGFKTTFETLFPSGTVGLESANDVYNQGVQFAGTILSILPLIIIYFFTQRWFIESADRSGIAGE